MSFKRWTAGLVVAIAVAVVATVADASTVVRKAKGRLKPVAASGTEKGLYRIGMITRTNPKTGNSREADRIEADARNLNVSGASATSPPNFHVYLVTSASNGSTAFDFGKMRVNKQGKGLFAFDTRRKNASLPSGVSSLGNFAGGTIEVRDSGGNAVLSAPLK